MLDSEKILDHLFTLMVLKGKRQSELADAIGISRPTVSKWARNESANLDNICTAFRVLGFELVPVPLEERQDV